MKKKYNSASLSPTVCASSVKTAAVKTVAVKTAAITIALVIFISLLGPSFLANAYWWDISPYGRSKNTTATLSIGTWQFDDTPKPPDGVIVVVDDEDEDLLPNKVVYHNGDLVYIFSHGANRDFVGKTQPNYNTLYFGWKWYPFMIYQQNQAVIYNGRVYIGAADTGNLVGIVHNPETAQFWDLVGSVEWQPNKVYRVTGTIVEYNGNLYRTKWHTTATTTPDKQDSFELLTNTAYILNRSYTSGSVVRYNGGVYQAMQNTNKAPETVKGHWKRLDSPIYSTYQQYALHDVVLYNGHYYQVVNASLANAHAPTTLSYAWNQIDTYDYNPQNIYKLHHLVIYNNVVYRSKTDGNIKPITDTTAWEYYGSSPPTGG